MLMLILMLMMNQRVIIMYLATWMLIILPATWMSLIISQCVPPKDNHPHYMQQLINQIIESVNQVKDHHRNY